MSLKQTSRNDCETSIQYLKYKDYYEVSYFSKVRHSAFAPSSLAVLWSLGYHGKRNQWSFRRCSVLTLSVDVCTGEMLVNDTHKCVYGTSLFFTADLRSEVATLVDLQKWFLSLVVHDQLNSLQFLVVSCYYPYRTTNLFLRGWQIFPQ